MTQPDLARLGPTPHLRLAEPCEAPRSQPSPSHRRPFAHALNASRAGRAYLEELQAIPPLSRGEEREVALRIEQGERHVLSAMLSLPDVRLTLRRMLEDAAAGHVPIHEVLDESPDDELALARVNKLLSDLDNARGESQVREVLAKVRIGRQALARLSSKVAAENKEVLAEVRRGRATAEAAKRELVRHHLWLAVSMAVRHTSRGLDLLDSIQEGNLGLLQAADRFRVRKGFRFATYASWWVRRAIHRAAAEQGHCVRLPPKTLEAAQTADRIEQRSCARNGHPADERHVATALSVSVDRLREVRRGISDSVEVDAPAHPLFDLDPTPEEAVSAMERHQVVREQVDSLAARERKVIALRFGLKGEQEATRDEVARIFSLTRERIRQVEKEAIRRLQHPAHARVLRAV